MIFYFKNFDCYNGEGGFEPWTSSLETLGGAI